MRLRLIQGGQSASAERADRPGTSIDLWLARVEPDLARDVGRWLDQLTSAGRARAEADLAAAVTADLRTAGSVVDAAHPSGPAPLVGSACVLLGVAVDRPVAVPALTAVLTSTTASGRVRQQAAAGLARQGGVVARRVLANVLIGDADVNVRARAARALGVPGDNRAIAPLVAVVGNSEEAAAVRGEAAEALGVIGHAAVEPLLMHALGDADAEVRIGAINGLGLLGGLGALPALQELVAGDPREVSDLGSVAECAAAAVTDILRRAMIAV